MGTTTPASLDDLEKAEMAVRIRDRIVRIHAERVLATLDAGDDLLVELAHLRDAVAQARAAADAFEGVAFGMTPKAVTA